jgi:hypothetical protein
VSAGGGAGVGAGVGLPEFPSVEPGGTPSAGAVGLASAAVSTGAGGFPLSLGALVGLLVLTGNGTVALAAEVFTGGGGPFDTEVPTGGGGGASPAPPVPVRVAVAVDDRVGSGVNGRGGPSALWEGTCLACVSG